MPFYQIMVFYMRRGRNLSAAALLMSLIIWLSFSAAAAAENGGQDRGCGQRGYYCPFRLRQISRTTSIG